jgi:hypothetical protein
MSVFETGSLLLKRLDLTLGNKWLKQKATVRQGDQIGQFLAYWVIVYYERF